MYTLMKEWNIYKWYVFDNLCVDFLVSLLVSSSIAFEIGEVDTMPCIYYSMSKSSSFASQAVLDYVNNILVLKKCLFWYAT